MFREEESSHAENLFATFAPAIVVGASPSPMEKILSARLDKDWFGQPVPAAPECELRLDAGSLTLRARVKKPPLTVAGDTGGYAEGLWEGDCAELFLVNPKTGYYLEFNLSPKGGWWCCAFTAPRVRAPGAPRETPGVVTQASSDAASWSAEIRIPVASLPAEVAFDPAVTAGNITFCLGNAPQIYLTYADLGGGKPDFHLPGKWVRLFV